MISIDPKIVQEVPMGVSAMAKKPDAIDFIKYKGNRCPLSSVIGSVHFEGHDYAVLPFDRMEVTDSRLKAAGTVAAVDKTALTDSSDAEGKETFPVYRLRRQLYVQMPESKGVCYPMVR
ncbi:MAG: hypothetical protein IKS18_02870 [Lachnospiraceae bacterium]|nr:hypothetical protein [Lachnospiraceae bacterium]